MLTLFCWRRILFKFQPDRFTQSLSHILDVEQSLTKMFYDGKLAIILERYEKSSTTLMKEQLVF